MHTPIGIPAALPPAVIIGNGPSLRAFDLCRRLSGFATFGMNAAYRFWDRLSWYPQYYSCLDHVVGQSHKEAILRLIDNAENYGIKGFLLRDSLIQVLGEYGRRTQVVNFEEEVKKDNLLLRPALISTGSHTCSWAASLGYKDIVLVGVDAHYIPIIKEARKIDGMVLEVIETPETNPNYFFDDYQRKGDLYNIPNHQPDPDKGTHLESWRGIRMPLAYVDAVVVNAAPQSRVDAFPHCEFDEALSVITRIREGKKQSADMAGLVGIYPRSSGAGMREELIIAELFGESDGVMIDVGAFRGSSAMPFLQKGWTVYAFEPEAENRAALQKNTAAFPKMHIDSRAVSKVTGRTYPFYTTPESLGACTMRPFTPAHQYAGDVTTVTLYDYCTEHNISIVDFLKIDTEGFDFMVLQGFPFASFMPQCIMCEFEDKKTVPLGASMHSISKFLQEKGYDVYVSEWHPVIRYGIAHEWRRIVPYPTETATSLAWGNLLAFKTPPPAETLQKAVNKALCFHAVAQ